MIKNAGEYKTGAGTDKYHWVKPEVTHCVCEQKVTVQRQ